MGLPLEADDFRTIARHEIGHAIGLRHSNDNGEDPLDLMASTFDFVSISDDIYPSLLNLDALINAVYGTDGFGDDNISPIPPSYI